MSCAVFHTRKTCGRIYKPVEITCFTKVFYVTAFGFVGWSCFSHQDLARVMLISPDVWVDFVGIHYSDYKGNIGMIPRTKHDSSEAIVRSL